MELHKYHKYLKAYTGLDFIIPYLDETFRLFSNHRYFFRSIEIFTIVIPFRNSISDSGNSTKCSTRVSRGHLLLYFFRTTHFIERISHDLARL